MGVISGIFTGLKLLGIGGGFIRDLRKDSLDYKLAASQTKNEAEKQELLHKAKVIDLQLEDIQDARSKAAGLPKYIIFGMVANVIAATLWFWAGVLRGLYGYAEFTPLDESLNQIVMVIMGFMFGGASYIVAKTRKN